MICDQCGNATRVVETRDASYKTLRRRRECTHCGNRFNTYEIRERVLPAAKDALRRAEVAIDNRLERRRSDIELAKRLHEGSGKLAEELGVHPKTVERSARRGREHMKKERAKRV